MTPVPSDDDRGPETDAGFYDEPTIAWSLRAVGSHLHPGGEEATVLLAQRAANHGFPLRSRILDLGSGLGAPSRFLARRFLSTVVGVDSERGSQRAARGAAVAEGLAERCPLVLGRGELLPFASETFDGAWSQDALGHMNKEAVIREFARVLVPGGLLVFSDWIARAPLTGEQLSELERSWNFQSPLRVAEYVALLEANGFELLLAEDVTYLGGARGGAPALDQERWEADFARRYGSDELAQQESRVASWVTLLKSGAAGNGMFVARKRSDLVE